MKTQIIRLDAYDDNISARDKMGWNRAGRILLVWPERSHQPTNPGLERKLDLVLLQRHSHALGAQLVLVTREPRVQQHALELGLPVFNSLVQAQKAHWRADRRFRVRQEAPAPQRLHPPPDLPALRQALRPASPPWLESPWFRLPVFSLGLLAILALAALLAPSATLELSPRTLEQSLTFDIFTSPDLPGITLSGGLPAQAVTVVVEGRDEIQSQGSQRIPQDYASGEVVCSNLTTITVQIPRGSIIRTSDDAAVRFETTRAATIAAGTAVTNTLPVQALLAGPTGNLPAGSLAAIEGPLGLRMVCSNPQPTRGGTDRIVPAPTEYNQERLFELLQLDLRSQAWQELQSGLAPGDLLLPETMTLTRVIEQMYDPAGLQPANQLRLTLQLEYRAYRISGADLERLAAGVLDANLPDDYRGLAETLQVQVLQPPVMESGADTSLELGSLAEADPSPDVEGRQVSTAGGRLRARRQAVARLAADRAVQMVLGCSPELASAQMMNDLKLASPPAIRLLPAWWPRLPLIPQRVSVVINENTGR